MLYAVTVVPRLVAPSVDPLYTSNAYCPPVLSAMQNTESAIVVSTPTARFCGVAIPEHAVRGIEKTLTESMGVGPSAVAVNVAVPPALRARITPFPPGVAGAVMLTSVGSDTTKSKGALGMTFRQPSVTAA